MVPNAPKLYETHRNMSLGSNGVDRVHSLRKILKRLLGTNFCTSSARFAPSFVTQPNGRNASKLYEMHQNISLGSKDISGAFVSKNFDATSCHELLYQFGPFCTEFCKSTKRSQMHQNCTKCTKHMSLGSNGEEQVRLLRKIPTTLRGTNFCTILACFHRVW